jgi:hypothetical protein
MARMALHTIPTPQQVGAAPVGVFESFQNATDWQAHFTVDVAAGAFDVIDGRGVLKATSNADVYLKTRDIPFSPAGFSVATQTRRTASNGQMTEYEMGRDGWGPIWHFEWSDTVIYYFLTEGNPATMTLKQQVAFASSNPLLRIFVTATIRGIAVNVVDVTNGQILISRDDDLDWAVLESFQTQAHVNWVTTGNANTTAGSPVAQSIDWAYVGPAGGVPPDGAFRSLFVSGGNVVRTISGATTVMRSGRATTVGGSGLETNAMGSVLVTFSPAFSAPPYVVATPRGNMENGAGSPPNGLCAAWIYQLSASQVGIRVKNFHSTIQTIDVDWLAIGPA